MSLGKRLFIGGAAAADAACSTDSVQPFGAESAYSSNVALYQLDGNANDTVGNHNSTASNVTYSTGKFGQCAVFNGSSQYITTGVDSSDISMTNTSFSCWVNFTATSGTIMDNGGAASSGRGLILETGSGYIVWQQANGTSGQSTAITTASNSYNDGNWHHVVGTIDGNRVMKLYIDGNVETSTPTANSSASSPLYTLEIGRRAFYNSQYFNGSIDQVRIYDKALSSDEVSILYNETTSTASDTNVLGEGSGLALYTLDYDASDESGNYDGTPTDVTFGVDGQINWGAKFNGSSSYIDTNLQMPSTTTFTFSCWFYKNDSANYHLIGDFNSTATLSSGRFRVQLASTDDISVGVGNGTNMDFSVFTPTVSLNQIWRHIAVTVDGTSVKAYIDGSQVGTTDTSLYSLASGVNDFAIGAYHTSSGKQNFNGTIDQVRIFQKALSQNEVDTLYGETACVYTSTTDQVDYQGTNLAYYKFDNTALDETTNNHDGTEYNINYEFGRYGQAADFNGSSSYISVAHNSSFNWTGNKTISLWVKFDSLGSGSVGLAAKSSNSSPYGWFVYKNGADNKIAFSHYNSSDAASSVVSDYAAVTDVWYHICVTGDGTTNKLYINGQEEDSANAVTGTNVTDDLVFGRFYTNISNYYFDGNIDQVRFYESTLDATAVENLYNEKPETDTSNFKTVLYEGNGSSQYVSNVGFQPDFVWIKNRVSANAGLYFDSVRGVEKYLRSDGTMSGAGAEVPLSGAVSSFDSNGFTHTSISNGSVNRDGDDYVAWCWKGGGDAVQNNDGTLTSQVSANPDAGFSIVKWTNNNAVRTVGHGLNSTPELIIFKRTDTSQNWYVETDAIDGSYDYLVLNDGSSAKVDGSGAWSTRATSSTITSFTSTTNSEYIAYCFHSVTGYQKIGSYTGGGSSGRTVNTGFRPRWVMIRRTDVGNYWVIIDSVRDTSDPYGQILYANANDQEAGGGATTSISFTDTGFSMSTSAVGGSINASGGTYLYLAIA